MILFDLIINGYIEDEKYWVYFFYRLYTYLVVLTLWNKYRENLIPCVVSIYASRKLDRGSLFGQKTSDLCMVTQCEADDRTHQQN